MGSTCSIFFKVKLKVIVTRIFMQLLQLICLYTETTQLNNPFHMLILLVFSNHLSVSMIDAPHRAPPSGPHLWWCTQKGQVVSITGVKREIQAPRSLSSSRLSANWTALKASSLLTASLPLTSTWQVFKTCQKQSQREERNARAEERILEKTIVEQRRYTQTKC